MPVAPDDLLRFEPAEEGWLVARTGHSGRFVDLFRSIGIRAEGPDHARVRFETGDGVRNIADGVHGGYILAAIDQALFMACRALGSERGVHGVTLDTSCQFIAPIAADRPMEAVVERLRETGRLVFLRGTIEQQGAVAAAFSGTVRKASG